MGKNKLDIINFSKIYDMFGRRSCQRYTKRCKFWEE